MVNRLDIPKQRFTKCKTLLGMETYDCLIVFDLMIFILQVHIPLWSLNHENNEKLHPKSSMDVCLIFGLPHH